MNNSFKKRLLAFCIALLMLVPVIQSITPYLQAAGTLTVTDSNIGLSWTDASNNKGTASWSANGSTVTGNATGYVVGKIQRKAVTTTLTITNNASEDLTLSFDWTLADGGSVSGIISTTSGSYSETLAAGSSVTITLTSPTGANTNELTISGLQLLSSADITSTFSASENGSYTVDGTSVVETTQFIKSATDTYALSATPDSGYSFFGWWSEASNSYISYDNPATLRFGFDPQIKPVFIDETIALFRVGEAVFLDLTEACQYALTATFKTVVLFNNGTVTGSHTIPEGITLLVPFDDANTLYTDTPGCTSSDGNNVAWVQPTAYRTLTLAADANIVVNGDISVSAQHSAANGGKAYSGSPTGPVSFVNMTEGSNITLNSGANLYAWGFITGAGTVTAKSGATVYENFQIADFRGGSNSLTIVSDGLVFPMNQYYIQNIEVPVTFEAGASEFVYTSAYVQNKCLGTAVKFIGEGGMFIAGEGSTVTKDYIENRDRLQVDMNGDGSLNSLGVEMNENKIDSSKFILPINSNIIINIKSGTTTLNQSVALLPGVEITVDDGAVLDLGYSGTAINDYCMDGYNIVVYDRDEWFYGLSLAEETMGEEVTGVAYAFGSKTGLREVLYAPGRTYTRTAAKDLNDAVLDINGTLVANGFVYTTAGGAAIKSSGKTGVIEMVNGAGYDMITCQANGATSLGIPMNSAMLMNGDGSYLPTIVLNDDYEPIEGPTAVAGDVYNYCADCDKWSKQITVTFNPGEGTGSMDSQIIENTCCGESLTLNSFTNGDKAFAGWVVDGTEDAYADGSVFNGTESVVLTATWKKAITEYDVTFKNEDGSKNLVEPFKVENGTTVTYSGETPTKLYEGADDCHSYQFMGWSTEVNGEVVSELKVTSDVTYYAVFELKASHNSNEYLYVDNGNGTHKVIYDCCGNVLSDSASHTEAIIKAEAPTCTDPGLTEGKYCSDCNAVIVAQEVDPALGHNWGDTYTSNGNGSSGTHYQTCTECFDKKDAEAHDWNDGVIDPDSTCTEEGVKTYTCKSKGCGATYTEVLSSTGHNYDETTHICKCGKVEEFTVTWIVDGNETVETYEYGTAPSFKGSVDKAADENFTYTLKGWNPEIAEVSGDITYTAVFAKTGFTNVDNNIVYIDKDVVQKTGWTAIDGEWYYFDTVNGYASTGNDRVIYPSEAINGITYAPNAEDFAYWESHKDSSAYTDAETALFVFGENGKFDSSLTGIIDDNGTKRYVKNGMIGWHVGLVQDGNDYYYFSGDKTGNGNIAVTGNAYVTRLNGIENFVKGGIYTFGNDGKLCKYDGIEEIENELYYYENWRLATDKGLFKLDNDYYYVYSSSGNAGKLAVNTSCWIDWFNGRKFGIAVGLYEFDGEGKLINPISTHKKGVYNENGEWYYYVAGRKNYAGAIEYTGSWIDESGDVAYEGTATIYVNSSGKLVTGKYWPSKNNGILESTYNKFDEYGRWVCVLDGIVEENGNLYYYKNGTINSGAGLVKMTDEEGKTFYIYVRSSTGTLATGEYWPSLRHDLLPGGYYDFGTDGRYYPPVEEEIEKLDGIVEIDGKLYYYEDGKTDSGAGLVKMTDEEGNTFYIYVRSSTGTLATGKYWPTLRNDLLPSGYYDFGTDGRYYPA